MGSPSMAGGSGGGGGGGLGLGSAHSMGTSLSITPAALTTTGNHLDVPFANNPNLLSPDVLNQRRGKLGLDKRSQLSLHKKCQNQTDNLHQLKIIPEGTSSAGTIL